MLVHLHRLRDRGVPTPRYQFAFRPTIAGVLTVHEVRDAELNRYTRQARMSEVNTGQPLDVPALLDAQLLELTAERLLLSGIERVEYRAVSKIEDFAQTWVCWLEPTS